MRLDSAIYRNQLKWNQKLGVNMKLLEESIGEIPLNMDKNQSKQNFDKWDYIKPRFLHSKINNHERENNLLNAKKYLKILHIRGS